MTSAEPYHSPAGQNYLPEANGKLVALKISSALVTTVSRRKTKGGEKVVVGRVQGGVDGALPAPRSAATTGDKLAENDRR
ncbi:hypothetical protein O9929_16035 [Vibrio lentus]|nr:hypothetical protein [Vibrio lentus]